MKNEVLDWLGFRQKFDFKKAKPLGVFLGFIITLFALLLLPLACLMLLRLAEASIGAGRFQEDSDGSAIRNIGLVIVAFLGSPFLIWRTISSAKQVAISEESLYNDKVNSAADALSSRYEVTDKSTSQNSWQDDLVARMAAIDRLEGLAIEQPSLSTRIVKLLAAYIRGNFGAETLTASAPPFERKIPRMDFQRSIDALGRLLPLAQSVDAAKWRLDLTSCNFDGVRFNSGNFTAADFTNSRFEASILDGGTFEGCIFDRTLLNFASFRASNCKGASFNFCTLNQPKPTPGGMIRSINLANIYGATFIGSDISAIDYLGTKEVIGTTMGTSDTKVSAELKAQMLNQHQHQIAFTERNASKNSEPSEDLKKLESTGFQHWTPFDTNDLATGWCLERFRDELGLSGWPFR